jgi:hypothetical protein
MDNVKYAHIRCLPESGLEFWLRLYNESLNSAETSVDWKRTRIVTVLKSGKDPVLAHRVSASCSNECFFWNASSGMLLELWAEKPRILAGTQFGFRKGKGTTECLTIEVKTAFHLKN